MDGYYLRMGKQAGNTGVVKQAREKMPLVPSAMKDKSPEGVQTFTNSETVLPKETVCDTVYQANGVRMIVKVTRVNKNKTYYLLCDSDNEAEFDIETAKLKKIAYANGKTDSLKKLTEDPEDYYRRNEPGHTPKPFQKRSELEVAKSDAEMSLILVIAGILVFPLLIAGLVIANKAKRALAGKRGYERAYNQARIASGIGIGCLLVIAFFIALVFAILLGVLI
jgi:hypothetical protein